MAKAAKAARAKTKVHTPKATSAAGRKVKSQQLLPDASLTGPLVAQLRAGFAAVRRGMPCLRAALSLDAPSLGRDPVHSCHFRLYVAYKLASSDVHAVERELAAADPLSRATFGLSDRQSSVEVLAEISAQIVSNARPPVSTVLATVARVCDDLAIAANSADTRALLRSMKAAEKASSKLAAVASKNQAAIEFIASKRLRQEEMAILNAIYAAKLPNLKRRRLI